MTNLHDLAERVEQASGPDRELDAKICRLIDLPLCVPPDCAPDVLDQIINRVAAGEWTDDPDVPFYTASLDAAMTLVPEGWPSLSIYVTDDGLGHAALAGNDMHMMAEDPDEFYVEADAATPALALVAAALRSKDQWR